MAHLVGGLLNQCQRRIRTSISGVDVMDEVSDRDILDAVRAFVERDVIPAASALEHRDEYPHQMVATMRELGLFAATIPTEFGGLGLSYLTYARAIQELSPCSMPLPRATN